MTKSTELLVNELSRIVDASKYLILTGGIAVGKTFIAEAITEKCREAQFDSQGALPNGKIAYEIEKVIVPIHPSYSYEDFVEGTAVSTSGHSLSIRSEDKVFLDLLQRANQSWAHKDNRKYFLILDGIERGDLSGILGELLPLLELHGNSSFTKRMKNNTTIRMTPNLYIIATYCDAIDSSGTYTYGLFRHFYHRRIESDYSYMADNASPIFSNYDITANAMYYRTNRLIIENLHNRSQSMFQEKDKYAIGHGLFIPNAVSAYMRLQIIPLLLQYVKDGVLDKTALIPIDALNKTIEGNYTKDPSRLRKSKIERYRKGITPSIYFDENTTHKPIVNLVFRILEQRLLTDADIIDKLLFNGSVLIRKSAGVGGTPYSAPGYLFVPLDRRGEYTYTKSNRFLYSAQKKDHLFIQGVEYCAAAEMQPKEYTRWSDDLNSDSENERYSSSPNSIMFRILKYYYATIIGNCENYLLENPDDSNIRILTEFAKHEFSSLIEFIKTIGAGSDEANVNLERNLKFRRAISELTLLWSDLGDLITWNGQSFKVEGVYKMSENRQYSDYLDAMNMLGIHQMILQGPPGTSKTYSVREFLKYLGAGEDNESFLSDADLDAFQIKSYSDNDWSSEWKSSHPDKPQPIAWDIVQFHPSYGYEDFVRGIEVSTRPTSEQGVSAISYDTVNKILGKMASIASTRPETKFYLIIDEINRANLATVFGELIYGLEYRERSIATPYTVNDSNKISLPQNLYILGTMNTADKSIGGIDYAIRRRFLFFSVLPNRKTIENYTPGNLPQDEVAMTAQKEINSKAALLFDCIERLFNPDNLNSEYYKDDIQVGHTYFLVSSIEQLRLRFRYQIIPILREYYKDGMFQFEEHDSEDAFQGLLNCVMDNIDGENESDYINSVFDRLINLESSED